MIDPDHDLEYGGTLGWSGSDTSRERAEDEAESGLASARLSLTHDLVSKAGPWGLTWFEIAKITGWHHGQATGALSNLHKAGDLARLRDRRGRSKIYVTPDNVQGRLTERQGRKASQDATHADLSASGWAALREARDRARSLYSATGGRVGPATVENIWPSRDAYELFWRAVSRLLTEKESSNGDGP